jgi:spermidine/putrescine transport system ATP-binding protein
MNESVVEFKQVSKSYDDNQVLFNINFSIKKGEFITLLGPSGCGKTTLLRLISGLEDPDHGQITITNKNMTGMPPHLRQVHTVFQSYALFPHMSVYENVAFGLRCKKVPKEELHERVMEALKMVKLDRLADRKATRLSGGQQQRVAIARAVVNRPLVLLLDEPLSSLDYHLRRDMQIELKQLQRKLGIAFVFVTHDQEEALSISDRVVIMDEGYIQQIGTPRQVYENPENLTVAKFIGEVNLFDGVILEIYDNKMLVEFEGNKQEFINRRQFQKNDKIHILIRPEDLRVWNQNEVDDTQNMLPGKVEEVIYKGSTVNLMVRLANNKLLAATEFFDEDDEKLEYTIGESVWINWLSGWETILPYETR